MPRLSLLLFSLFATLFVGIASSPVSDRELRSFGVGDIINALGVGLVTKINVYINIDTFVTNLVSIDFDVKNPLLIELALDGITTTAGINSTVYSSFEHTFSTPLVVPPLGSANSGRIQNVLLTQGVEKSLDIIPLGYLDLINADAKVRAATIKGKWGIPIPLDGLKQKNVTTTYTIEI